MRTSHCTLILLILLALVPAISARADDRPTVLIVVGAEGSAEYAPVFAESADRWADAATRGSANVIQIGRARSMPGNAEPQPGPGSGDSPTDKQRLFQALAEEIRNTTQPLWIVLIGHDTFDGKEAKFNLRGPDVSDAELTQWLRPCVRPLAVVDCSSASAPFLNRLSGKNRVVITATRSGHEVNFARFGQCIAASIADAAADLDKDGQTSLLEAFIAASHRVEEFYKTEGRLATEHALLDDNGDAKGIPADWFQGVRAVSKSKTSAPLDGARAHQWHLILSPAEKALSAYVRAKRDALELLIESLRTRKGSMAEDQYYAELERLLLALARIYEPAPGR